MNQVSSSKGFVLIRQYANTNIYISSISLFASTPSQSPSAAKSLLNLAVKAFLKNMEQIIISYRVQVSVAVGTSLWLNLVKQHFALCSNGINEGQR